VARSVGRYTSPRQLEPTTKNAVPKKPVRLLNIKKAARVGASAVPREKAVNRVAEIVRIYLIDYY